MSAECGFDFWEKLADSKFLFPDIPAAIWSCFENITGSNVWRDFRRPRAINSSVVNSGASNAEAEKPEINTVTIERVDLKKRVMSAA